MRVWAGSLNAFKEGGGFPRRKTGLQISRAATQRVSKKSGIRSSHSYTCSLHRFFLSIYEFKHKSFKVPVFFLRVFPCVFGDRAEQREQSSSMFSACCRRRPKIAGFCNEESVNDYNGGLSIFACGRGRKEEGRWQGGKEGHQSGAQRKWKERVREKGNGGGYIFQL